uniref:Transmembrane 9 superfamily member n=1 Tax=Arcella intermedia TaxID=1963864 RepID=A0A6B2L0K6_9EUKA
MGPYDNPDESYSFAEQNVFCQPKDLQVKDQGLGEELEGDTKTVSIFELKFAKSFTPKTACSMTYEAQQLAQLKDMIRRNFYYEFDYDNIPVYGFVGKYHESERDGGQNYYLYTHYKFFILYHQNVGDQTGYIVHVNITRDIDSVVLINDKVKSIDFKYSATWIKSDIAFDDRDQVWTNQFFTFQMYQAEMEIHWLSIFNSFVLVLLLTAFVALILMKILNRDYVRYSTEDKDETEYGWKQVASDAFRFPIHENIFCALVGVGSQFIVMAVFLLFLAIIGLSYPGNDGAMRVSAVVLYALTALISGFVSSFWYKKMEGPSWPWNILLTASVFALPFLIMAFFVNSVAIFHHVTKALPITAILAVLLIWLLVGIPLTVVGGITGKNYSSPFVPPVRVKKGARELPYVPWYRRLPIQMLMGGFLSFSAIYVELHYIFHSVWGRGFYHLWGILFLVFIILLIVTATTTIALTYFQLSMEDYRWWWASFLTGGSTGIFIFGYSIYYYIYRSRMTGFLQASFYFGYQGLICYYFFLMLGAVGFFSSYLFVRQIYKNIHTD